jgi:class 3 adenylate cyclase
MKRKIAAIFAVDIAGYSRLVAEDEEETLRRLSSYRSVTDDFIAKAGGRIFNTAGDAVLAEFPSAVEAVRCAIDIQESLRTRNMAYPASRHMSFRIGITIGDVVERDGDLLGDGVNIAARLEGLAEVGGICISRTVHEQVVNKLSVQFSDIGAQDVKNIPTPVHAYMVALRREDGTYSTPQFKKQIKVAKPNWIWPVAATMVLLAAISLSGGLYFTKDRMPPFVTERVDEDCVTMNPLTTRATIVRDTWKLVDGNNWILDFNDKSDQARRAEQIVKFYGLNRYCFIGRPKSSFNYWLVGDQSPIGSMPNEDCLEFNPNTTTSGSYDGLWKVVDGNRAMFATANQLDAERAIKIIRHYGFNRSCFVGRPGPTMSYLRKS